MENEGDLQAARVRVIKERREMRRNKCWELGSMLLHGGKDMDRSFDGCRVENEDSAL